MIRAIGYRLGAAVLAAVALLLLGGQIATGYRIAVAVTTFALVALSWPLRRRRLAELHQLALRVRLGGYAAAWALLATTVALLRLLATTAPVSAAGRSLFGRSDDDTASALLIFLLVIGYAALALALTGRRLHPAPPTLACGGFGALAGALVYLTAPYGGGRPEQDRVPLALAVGGACLLAGYLAARRLPEPAGAGARYRQGLAAGVLAAATGAVVATGLTFGAMCMFPYRVPGPIAYPHALSAAALNVRPAAAPYVALLLVAPFAGVLLGTVGATAGVLARRATRWARARDTVPGPTSG